MNGERLLSRRVTVLGGYGRLGRQIVLALGREISGTVTIAGRRLEAAQAAVKGLASRVPGGIDLEARTLDVEDADALAATLAEDNALIHCAPLAGAAGEALLNALLRTGGRAVLLTHERETIRKLRESEAALVAAGASVVFDAGADPGLPGLLGRLAVERHGAAETVEIAARYRDPGVGRAGVADILDGASEPPQIFDEAWRGVSPFAVRRIGYPGGLGRALSVPAHLPELDALPQRAGLRRVELWHAGMNGAADIVVMAWRLGAGKIFPRRWGLALLGLAIKLFTRRPYGVAVTARVFGAGGALEISIFHPGVYRATAVMAARAAVFGRERQSGGRGVLSLADQLMGDEIIGLLRRRGFVVNADSRTDLLAD